MIELKKRQFLDFEKPIKELYDQIEQLKITSEKSKTNMSGAIAMLEECNSLAKSTVKPPSGQALHHEVHC
jgi:acetyl-CoA carboxylase alpha subunit